MSESWISACIIGYLCGSIPFALLLGFWRGIDIRKVGSGNVGATNVSRALGRRWGIACFVLDVLKGFIPVFAAGLAMGLLVKAAAGEPLTSDEAWRWLAVMASPVIGHIFPVWLRFRGGKGVATGFGALLGVWPVLTIAAAGALIVWIIVVKVLRYIGLASVAAALSLPLFVLLLPLLRDQPLDGLGPFLIVTGLLALLVTFRHRANLIRTFAGREPKVGGR